MLFIVKRFRKIITAKVSILFIAAKLQVLFLLDICQSGFQTEFFCESASSVLLTLHPTAIYSLI